MVFDAPLVEAQPTDGFQCGGHRTVLELGAVDAVLYPQGISAGARSRSAGL